MDADMERAFNNMMKRIQKEVEDKDEVVEVSEVKEDADDE